MVDHGREVDSRLNSECSECNTSGTHRTSSDALRIEVFPGPPLSVTRVTTESDRAYANRRLFRKVTKWSPGVNPIR